MNHQRISQLYLVTLLLGKVCVYAQQTGYYLDETETRLPENLQLSDRATMGDVDLDGDMDIVVANAYTLSRSGLNRMLINDGIGHFTDETESRLPFWEDNSGDVALLDIDGDGDLDYMVGNTFNNAAPDGKDRLYLNDGTGHFEDVSSERIPQDNQGTVAIAYTDVDGDSDLDVFWTSYLGTRLLMNDGAGFFTDVSLTHLEPDTLGGLDAVFGDVDMDGDGYLDILFDNASTLVLLVNDSSGYYTDVSEERLPTVEVGGSSDAQFLDTDLDGDLDIFVSVKGGGGVGKQNLLYMNDGTGYFTDATESWLPQQTESSNGISLGDVDGDEDIDIFLACSGYLQNHLFINYLNTVGVEIETIQPPDEFVLLLNYPNPFNSRTRIGYELADQVSRITVSIYSVLGGEVVKLVDKTQKPGKYEVIWDGNNKFGEKVSAGVYICALYVQTVGGTKQIVQQRKLVFLR